MLAQTETTANARDKPRTPPWFWVAAVLGVIWNAYGISQFLSTVTNTEAEFLSMGMTQLQAALYASLPIWMDAAFALGVFGGLIGSLLLLARRALARPVFAVSLAAYRVLYVGDIALGVFAAFGLAQVIILTSVVVIALGLVGVAHLGIRRHILA